MDGYKMVSHSIDVPRNTGVDGFLHTLKEILKLPRIQEVQIDSKGRVTYKRYELESGEDAPLGVNFEGLEPRSIIRLGSVSEVMNQGEAPHILLSKLFDQVSLERMVAICWVVGARSEFWDWFAADGHIFTTREQLYGLPVHIDKSVSDTALILCVGYTKESTLVDCRRFFKLEVPPNAGLETTVDVL